MDLLINIPDHLYKLLKDFPSDSNETTIENVLMKAVENGTPLPKGHGDLKDMEDIYKVLEGWDDDTSWIVDAIDCQAPTIIEADAESEDKE